MCVCVCVFSHRLAKGKETEYITREQVQHAHKTGHYTTAVVSTLMHCAFYKSGDNGVWPWKARWGYRDAEGWRIGKGKGFKKKKIARSGPGRGDWVQVQMQMGLTWV